jgi:hypothetical protein
MDDRALTLDEYRALGTAGERALLDDEYGSVGGYSADGRYVNGRVCVRDPKRYDTPRNT